MPEEPFKNREILEMFGDVKKDLTEIKQQTTKHNGRMTAIERWQYTFMGGIGILTLVVVPLLGWALYTLANIKETVHRSVNEALSAYEITK